MQLTFVDETVEADFEAHDIEKRLLAEGKDISDIGDVITGVGVNRHGNTYISFDHGASYTYLNQDKYKPGGQTVYCKTANGDDMFDNRAGFLRHRRANGESLTTRRYPHVSPEEAYAEYVPPRGKDGQSGEAIRFPIPSSSFSSQLPVADSPLSSDLKAEELEHSDLLRLAASSVKLESDA